MYNVKLNWREFNVSLEDVHNKYLAEYPRPEGMALDKDDPDHEDCYYHGCTAGKELTLHFNKKPNDEAVFESYWASLTEASDEAVNYFSEDEYRESMKEAKLDAISKTWDELSTEQRKLVVQAELGSADKRQIISTHKKK